MARNMSLLLVKAATYFVVPAYVYIFIPRINQNIKIA